MNFVLLQGHSNKFKVLGDVLYPGPIEQVVSKYPGVQDVSVS